MARRYDHSREELYTIALDAACQMVDENGIRELTTRKLAKEIGYSVGTLYNLFDDQDDLIIHINGQTLDLLSNVIAAVPDGEESEQTIRAMGKAYIKFTQDNFNLWNSLFEHRLPTGRELPDWYREKIGKLLAMVEVALRPICGGNKVECQKAARVLWSSMHGICTLATAEKLDTIAIKSAEELAESLISNYLTGLKQRVN